MSYDTIQAVKRAKRLFEVAGRHIDEETLEDIARMAERTYDMSKSKYPSFDSIFDSVICVILCKSLYRI